MAESTLPQAQQPPQGPQKRKKARKKKGQPGQPTLTKRELRENYLTREAERIHTGNYKAVRRTTIDGSVFADLSNNHDNLMEQFRKKASSRDGAVITIKMQTDYVSRSEQLADAFNLLNAEMASALGWDYVPPRGMPNPLQVKTSGEGEKTAITSGLQAKAAADSGKTANPEKAAA